MDVPILRLVVDAAEAAKQVILSRLAPPAVIQTPCIPKSSAFWMLPWTSVIVAPCTCTPSICSAILTPWKF